MSNSELHTLAANTLRALAIDATNAADSGHPGAPMGMADLAVVLFTEVLRFDPSDAAWADRDRFVLSNGHASMLLYGLLHLAGYPLSMDELKRFRQLGSKTAGHPEYGLVPGIETTTGPLGQGFATGVGMAIGARVARQRLEPHAGFAPIDHTIYAFCGDGCLMEGVSAEAASLAGHMGLGELVYVWDDNQISIDGATTLTFTEDVLARFTAYGWHVLRIDGHDAAAIKAALLAGKAETARPTLIAAKTHIGFGSPNRQDTSKAHGSPLGAEEGKLAKAKLGWTRGPFEVPDEVRALFAAAAARGQAAHQAWREGLAAWCASSPERAAAWAALSTPMPSDSSALVSAALAAAGQEKAATRNTSGKVINALAALVPGLIGGSADLAESNKTLIKGHPEYVSGAPGAAPARNIAFGVREHAMGAVVNGLALYGYVPFGATFLTFADYMRPAIRLAALMHVRSLFVFTHDSIYLGEDGPTHQPVEHLWSLRVIPGLSVWRPADGVETAMAWTYAVAEGKAAPHALVFTRQNLPPLSRAPAFAPRDVWRGAYVLADAPGATVGIVATGSEVHVAVEAAALLAAKGIAARVVSMPCVERFGAQDRAYQDAVLTPGLRWVSFELGTTTPWAALVGRDGLRIGLDVFGESAPAEKLAQHFGFTAPQVAERIRAFLGA
jgi:transketolase